MSLFADAGSELEVKLDRLVEFDLDQPASTQLDLLAEDTFQATIQGLIFDLGWYPAHEETGQFVFIMVKGLDWERPLLEVRTPDLHVVLWAIKATLANYVDL